ncbi:MAG: Protein translocase subunit SecA [Candidatus Kaiserbacteria bacterium GW2011_GWA2_49_19]|uniref:Protein translocase subunit SecA n=1 Tax=Candidatus Kaiserbacteria bacterium GW2011_GWA2_49_19 TaxID=1618669 RepID=A0A0G1YSZ7_9BACT|nr:MAG: Protein translocase subunit SecA [Candidatus Kaiserbacteria bacterium GW2011_GWA2_49_19]
MLKRLFGDGNEPKIKGFLPVVAEINALETAIQALSDDALKARTQFFKSELASGRTLDEILPETFAVVREASRRTLGQRHFDVQLLGGIILHKGNIAEMRTGEGKTLVATLPAYLNALMGKGIHIVTVNDYLSRRDAAWMGQIYAFLGLSVGVINHESSFLYDAAHSENQKSKIKNQNDNSKSETEGGDILDKRRDELGSFKVVHEFLRPCSRKEAYQADITYGTNNEFGFDYLRDNISYDEGELRQRDFNFAIVDEVDSILIDEARTPLIISAATVDSEDLYGTFAKIAETLKQDEDYKVDEKMHAITLTDSGIEKAEKKLGVDNIYTEKGIKYVHHLESAVKAKALYVRDKAYVVKDDQVVIVDEFTGRLQPGRRWSEGLHQAVEAKEGVSVQKESRTMASITFQNYFRLYKKLSGMTGTAHTSSEEFYKVYGTDTLVVPTNKPVARRDSNDQIFQTETGKFKAIARKVKELCVKGQPVLIGTVSIEKNELLSHYLKTEGVSHEVLNAKNHEREGEIIAQAGRKSAVTIATNMAGRGVDIKLGGNPATAEEYEEVKKTGGLFVLGTERHEARRIDNQLRGRSGRQGDPGETRFFVSLEDTLMRVFASDTIKNLMGRFNIPEDQAIENRLITRSLETAQTKIEGFNFDARKHVLEYDDVLNHQRTIIYGRRRNILRGSVAELEQTLFEMAGADDALAKAVSEKKQAIGESEFSNSLRRLMLQALDTFWIEHLEIMDYMRGSVNLRAYGQRDPLVEYKKEGLRLFREMETAAADQIVRLIPMIATPQTSTVGVASREEMRRLVEVHEQAQVIGSGDGESNRKHHGNPRTQRAEQSSHDGKPHEKTLDGQKVGRNDVCPCGSGKKYKKCHGV